MYKIYIKPMNVSCSIKKLQKSYQFLIKFQRLPLDRILKERKIEVCHASLL